MTSTEKKVKVNTLEEDFEPATSENIPEVDFGMVHEFYVNNPNYVSPEIRGIKNRRSMRDDYASDAVGYVQVRRRGNLCTVKARVTPEHRLNSTAYQVVANIMESAEGNEIRDCRCMDCAASLGGCKHNLALLAWLSKISMSPSVTSVQCYWKKSALSSSVEYGSCILARDMGTRKVDPVRNSESPFLEIYSRAGASGGTVLLLDKPPRKYSLHDSSIVFRGDTSYPQKSAYNFIEFLKQYLTAAECSEIEIETRSQSLSPTWYEVRYGRITGSTLYQLAHCNQEDGSTVQSILAGYSLPDNAAMERGRKLESSVIAKMVSKYTKAGFFMSPRQPIFGASPDALTEEHVIEVKCPSKATTVNHYLKKRGVLTAKAFAQVQLEMEVCGKKKALFGVASPNFENDGVVTVVEVLHDVHYCEDIMGKARVFWEKAIFPKIMRCSDEPVNM